MVGVERQLHVMGLAHQWIEELNPKQLAIEDQDGDFILENMFALEQLQRLVTDALNVFRHAVIAWIEENGNLVISEGNYYYVGVNSTVKVKDMEKLVEMLIQHCGNDLKPLVSCVAANGIKHGACRKLLKAAGFDEEKAGKIWSEHFDRIKVKTVRHESADPPLTLQRYDERYVR
jgi:hypothetical protein